MRRYNTDIVYAALLALTSLACGKASLDSGIPPEDEASFTTTYSGLAVTSVTASSFQDPNVPANTQDNNTATRWSAYGDGQWIQFKLGAVTVVQSVEVAWYNGAARISKFDIQTSLDGTTFNTVYSGASSGTTALAESVNIPDTEAAYVRIVGHGSNIGLWNSITEVDVTGASAGQEGQTPLTIVSATATSSDGTNVPSNVLDNNLLTRWSAYGDNQIIRFDLGSTKTVGSVSIAWYSGTSRQAKFDVGLSTDGTNFTTVFSGMSSGTTLAQQTFSFSPRDARYIRLVGHGNTVTMWNSITEFDAFGSSGTCVPTTCAQQGKNCGSISDGCGGTLTCGSCTSPNTCGGGGTANVCGSGSAPIPSPTDKISTVANLKVAFIGDTNTGSNYNAVLNLIKNEGAQAVVVAGDMSYSANPSSWWNATDAALGSSFPVFVARGNHDDTSWSGYTSKLNSHINASGAVRTNGPHDAAYKVVYKGLSIVTIKKGDTGTTINNLFNGDKHLWRICNWHQNQQSMQVGGKTNEMGWDVYETCRKQGAIIITGHEHTYERTKTLTNMTSKVIDPLCSSATSLCVGPGRSFVNVVGLGGNGIRDQRLCLPSTPPYGCPYWAKIYTSNQGAKFGAQFITFNVDGDPKKARGYFKNISGGIVDTFSITAD